MNNRKGRKVMTGMSFISPKYIQEGEFETMSDTMKKPQTGRHSRKLAAVLLAACLVFALAVTAYATDLFGLKDMFRTPNRELPEAAEPYIQKETAAAEEQDWSCEITESLADATTVMATVTVRGGDKYIIAPTDADPEEDPVSVIGVAGDQKLGQYAEEQGKTLLLVGARITKVGDQEVGAGSQKMESVSDHEMVILTQGTLTAPASGGEAVCQVYALEAGGSDVQRVELPFTLNQAPAAGETVYLPENPEAVPFLKTGDVTIAQTALGYSIRMPVTVTDQEVFYRNFGGLEFEGFSYNEGGLVMQSDDTWCFQADMCQGTPGGTITVRFRDMDEQVIGEIVCHKAAN